ncbi:chemotaxis protein CheA [Herbivorax sp. ANBcel31]|uniref:chemotaxis protein CheA n=1 Tax=Herbivorax sp. ANBcel31 TaxID=3069754 RepID=UPI0027AF0792|nr:chemotaxis protein CheA [Herbivorax sp. ANBcel31]MDQ2086631.1 chemotaxis protein CheA [Herbivorax sp. ANBcel31]
MADNMNHEPMVEMFVFETSQLMDELEQSLIDSEKESGFDSTIDEIFRIMHTVKGSAAMMMYDNISSLAHSIEDLFFYLREEKVESIDTTAITDMVLDGVDFIKNEVSKIQNGFDPDDNANELIEKIKEFLSSLKEKNSNSESKSDSVKPDTESEIEEKQQYYISSKDANDVTYNFKYEAYLTFVEGCDMENIRAFSVIHDLQEIGEVICSYPKDVIEDENACEIIQKEGFKIEFQANLNLEEVKDRLNHTLFLDKLEVCVKNDDFIDSIQTDESENSLKDKKEIDLGDLEIKDEKVLSENKPEKKKLPKEINKNKPVNKNMSSGKQSVISVNIGKLDALMDLVGELVISEAMVTQNPELKGLVLDSFHKAARQLNKITNELQDVVMSIRMVPLATTFQKMNRIVRDMSKKLNKSVDLKIVGEETEVDKNIIESISDPLIHLIRNSIDHGIEEIEEREKKGKSSAGNLVLEAKNAGGDVWIIIKDDGRGLSREKILTKARENGLIKKPEEELTDKEVYSFILKPGFSTKKDISEFSGRGVGMDIVMKNIEKVGGTVYIDSTLGEGTTISIKFPLTLAIIDGMTIKVGDSRYTIPTISIKESFKVKNEAVIKDSTGNEMIMVKGEAYPVLRLHKCYKINTQITDINDGIVIMVENDNRTYCIFADALLGEQQVVVKALPKYIEDAKGIAGCTLLGDGSISLILDISKLMK